MKSVLRLVGAVPVIPVLVIERAEFAVPIAEALVAGGLSVLEVTLRTADALAAVSAIRAAVPAAIVGVGSVLDSSQFASASSAGAQFAVSPGATPALHEGASRSDIPWLPGAQSVSDVLALRALGYDFLKFFPAQAAGGVNFLRSIAGPVAGMNFCPTGGISPANARDYLAVPNVRCIGGSWLTPIELVAERRWGEIRTLAQAARALSSHGVPALLSA
jgi:2-dehydro-3-deoxyphosphogluconate aldolase / (4S)-4-hydroxy-2-oxoglutarate aldolase